MGMSVRGRLAAVVVGALGLTGLASGSASAFAKTLWVGGAGCSDSGQGAAAQPYCTIQAAVSAAIPGTMVLVNPGTYTGPVNVTASGQSGAPITYSSVTPGAAKISGGANGFVITGQSYVTISGFAITGTTKAGISATSDSNITLSSNTVTSAGHAAAGQNAPGISLVGVTNSTISGNHADGNSLHGIVLGAGSTGNSVAQNEASSNAEGWVRGADGIQIAGSGNTVVDNVLHDNEQSGLHLAQGADATVAANNVAYNNGDHGIEAQNVANGELTSNTVYRNCTSGINVEGTSSGFSIKNNIAVDNADLAAYKGISCTRRTGNIGVYDSATSGTTVDSNLVNLTASGTEYAWGSSTYPTLAAFQSASGQGAHDLVADPKFANASGWNLHVTEGSPAIDSADSGASGEQATDADGTARVDDPHVTNTGLGSRAYDDRGAYEFQPAASGPTAALSLSGTSGIAPLTVLAEASGSKPGSTPIVSYTFDFGDGTVLGPQQRTNAEHVYSGPGTFTVKLTATDAGGLSGTTTSSVSVTGAGPTAVLTATPSSGVGTLTVTLDASGSKAGASPISSYDIAFGDGSADVIQNSATSTPVTHTYAAGYAYNASVTVADTAGQKSVASQTIYAYAQGPKAALTVAPSTGAPPLSVTADASASTAGSLPIANYKFSFGDGSGVVGPQSGATATHSYTTPGVYTVTVTVTDTLGITANAQQKVTVTGFSASLTLSTYAGNAPVQVTADGSGSLAGANPIASYSFNFGDGSAVVGPQTAATATHTYTTAGSYTVTLTVKDSSGASLTATKKVVVVDVGPAAALSLSTTNGPAPLVVTADASNTAAGSSSTLSYSFDFGDGSTVVGPQAAATAPHTYTTPGTYTVKVTVSDGNGLSSSTTANVTVTPHLAPTAAITATPTSGAAPLPVTADASGSSAGSSPIASYSFDFGDGSSVVGPQAAATASHSYTKAGSYTIKVTVTDTSGATATATVAVSAYSAPAAALAVNPASGTGPLQITADASASTAGSSTQLSYSFDFGDGSPVVGPQPGAAATHTYTAAGTFTVKVTVTDSNKLSSTASKQVVVTAMAPTAALAVTPASATVGTSVLADASASTPGSSAISSYAFDFGDGYTVPAGSAKTASYAYTAAGTYTVKATVTDVNGLTSTVTQSVTVTGGPGVPNGGFEIGSLADWNSSYNSGVTTANPHSGTYAGQINAPTGGNGSVEQVVTGLTPNTSYTLSGWIRTDGGTTLLGAKQFNAADDDTSNSTTATGWTQLSDQFTTGSTNTSVDIYCYRPTAGTSACDDFTLIPTPQAVGAVVNPGFETGTLAGWSDSYNAAITTSNPHGGVYAGQINAPTGGSGSIEQVVNGLTPSTSYILTGWVRTDGGATHLGAKQFNPVDDDTGATTTATGWTQLTDQFTTGPTNTSVDIYCYRPAAGTSACDDVNLAAIPATGQVTNGDFESGNLAFGWSASINAGTTTTNPHGGAYAGQINAPTGGSGSIEQVVNGLTPNTAYTLTGWVRTDGGATVMGAKQYDTTGHTTEATTTNTGWTQLTDQFTTGSTNTSVDIYCSRATAGTSACDDFALTKS